MVPTTNQKFSSRPSSSSAIKDMATVSRDDSFSNMSIVSMHATALDICYTIYGEATLSTEVIDRFYESSASDYENPVLTATSRSVIFDIFKLGRKFHALDIPRPLAAIFTLLQLQPPDAASNPLFQAMRVWNEVGHISEHESFDGQRKAIVEHTLNILLLPELHVDADPHAASVFAASDSLIHARSRPKMSEKTYHPGSPCLPIPMTSLSVPSPFHMQLHIMTRLSFNEQNRITHHRDFWDVKDLIGLIPGASLAHWVTSRITATGLSYTYRLLPKSPEDRDNDLDRAFDNDIGLQGLVINSKYGTRR